MNISVFATKIGMSQFFIGFQRIPVTILKIDINTVINKFFYKNCKKYTIQIGYQDTDKKNISKPLLGYFEKMNTTPKKYLREIIVPEDLFNNITIGHVFGINDIFLYKYIKATAYSIGKGFAGVIKRHNFKGFPKTHGTHEAFRHGGAIGCCTKPGHVFKNKKMPGRMGHKQVTIKNIKIIQAVEDKNLLLVKGAIPGYKTSLVRIQGQNYKS